MRYLRPPRLPGSRSRRRAASAMVTAALAALALAIMGSGAALASPARAASPAAAAVARAAARPSSPPASGNSGLAMMPGTSPSIAPMTDGGYWVAYQDTAGNLNIVWPGGHTDTGLGMMAGTSPSIVAFDDGSYEVAFQANTGHLWVDSSSSGGTDTGLGMDNSSSPAIAGISAAGSDGNDWEVAFDSNQGQLWTDDDGASHHTDQGIMSGSSPAIAPMEWGGYEVAFQAAGTGRLITVGDAGNKAWDQGIMQGTSPAITQVYNNDADGFEVAFQASGSNHLITVGNAGNLDWGLGMKDGTSPAIASYDHGYQVAFQANTGDLWSVGGDGNRDYGKSEAMMEGTSPAITGLTYGSYQVAFHAEPQCPSCDIHETGDLSTAGPGLPASPAHATGASSAPTTPHKKAAAAPATCQWGMAYTGSTWMGDLAPCLQSQTLGDIAIPGSHDTTTFSIGNPADHTDWQTQDEWASAQADAGARQFDIRVEPVGFGSKWDWYAHHGSWPTDGVSTWLTLTGIFTDLAKWAQTPGREHEVLIVDLAMNGSDGMGPSTNDVAACQGFAQEMGDALVTPSQFAGSFGTTDPGKLTLNQLWSLPDPNGYARVILDNAQCMGDANLDAGTWIDGPAYYADQCSAYGLARPADQTTGIITLVLQAVKGRNIGNGQEPNALQPTPPDAGAMYQLQITGTPEGDCLVSPWSMVRDEEEVLGLLDSQALTDPTTLQNLNIIAADYVDYPGFLLLHDVIGINEAKFMRGAVPAAPTQITLDPGDGGVAIEWLPPDGPVAVTSYTVTATNQTDPNTPPVTMTTTDTNTFVAGLTNGDSYVFTVTATNAYGTSPPAQAGPVTVGS